MAYKRRGANTIPGMPKQGRPTRLTPELQEKLCEAIAEGNYYECACNLVGIRYATFRQWMIWGEDEPSGIYHDFYNAVKLAEAKAESAVVREWQRCIPQNANACKEFLERRYPDRWGKRDKLDLKAEGKLDISQTLDVQRLIEDPEAAALACKLAELCSGKQGVDTDDGDSHPSA